VIEVSRYQQSDFDTLIAMHESQNSNLALLLDSADLPQLGYIAYDSATPIAIGFLRMLEGGYAMIDTLVSNGDLSSDIRHEGMTALIDQLTGKARKLGLKGLISLTADYGVIKRAEAIGFQVINQTAIGLSFRSTT
jgi:hypothetical protein